jgi:Domain of unknown function (DUF1707)
MSIDRSIRASDRDRDKATEILREAYAAGRLNREELDERSLTAYAARTWGELDDLTADVPAPPPGGSPPEMVATRNAVRYISHRRCVGKAVTCPLLLLAVLAGRMFPDSAWMVAAVLLALVIPSGRDGPRSR